MNHINRALLPLLLICLVIPAFSQSNSQKEESSPPAGLKKITNREHNREFCLHIDEDKLEASIESAVGNAMKALEVTLKNIEIEIDPIDIELKDLDAGIEPIEIHIPEIEIDINPIDIDFDQLDIDEDDFGRNENNDKWEEKDSKFEEKDIEQTEDKTGKENKDKATEKQQSKGLIKIK